MAFLLILSLSLSTFVTVEISSSGQKKSHELAKQNALLGLSCAIGQLQKLTGADQRTTARADLLTASTAGAEVENTKHNWTGVWDSTQPGASDGFLGWLISSEDPSVTNTLHSPTVPYTTKDLVTVLGESDDPNKNSAAMTYTDDIALHNKVDVPKINIPGTEKETGAYAYWISGENIKAPINLSDPFTDAAPSAINENRLTNSLRFQQPLKRDLRILDADVSYDLEDTDENSLLNRVLYLNAVNFITSEGYQAIRRNYHDFTTYSTGLFVDSRNGGLKNDLYRILDDKWNESPLKDKPIFKYSSSEGPYWNLLREHFNSYQNMSNPDERTPSIAPYGPKTITGNSLDVSNYNDDSINDTPELSGAPIDGSSPHRRRWHTSCFSTSRTENNARV